MVWKVLDKLDKGDWRLIEREAQIGLKCLDYDDVYDKKGFVKRRMNGEERNTKNTL